jgi:SAM-dependent methyltransferase
MSNFYDRTARQFGGYAFGTNKPRYVSEYLSADPEEVFKQELLALASPLKTALDAGCGDGKFAFEVSDRFLRIQGIDNSTELLSVANAKKSELDVSNVDFLFADASDVPLEAESFDVVFCRRGPSFYEEYGRLLVAGGHYVEVGIGEQDCVALKKVFGRGQNFGLWTQSRAAEDTAKFTELGFNVLLAKSIVYNEYYQSPADFDVFLQGVPIFEDYDSRTDGHFVDEYIAGHSDDPRGIRLTRHRVVYVVQK